LAAAAHGDRGSQLRCDAVNEIIEDFWQPPSTTTEDRNAYCADGVASAVRPSSEMAEDRNDTWGGHRCRMGQACARRKLRRAGRGESCLLAGSMILASTSCLNTSSCPVACGNPSRL